MAKERDDSTIAIVGTSDQVIPFLKKQEGDCEFIVIKSRNKSEANEWRGRVGQKVDVPATTPNCSIDECSVKVEHSDYIVKVSLHRPWLINLGGEKEEMVVPAVTIFFKCVRKLNTSDLAEHMEKHADSFVTTDRKEFLERVVTSARESGIVFDEEATRASVV
jgi:endonuclease IV